jgi:FlgD Ig-like domain
VVATVGAFFVTTRLKRSAPVIERLTFNRHFSPNGDGRFDFVQFALRLRHTDDATISIVTRDGTRVRTIADNLTLDRARRYHFLWDGRTASGLRAPDGEYHVRVSLRRQGRVVTSGRKIFLDTIPPRPVVGYVKPSILTPGGRSVATLRYSGPTRRPLLLVYRTDLRRPRLVYREVGHSGRNVLRWNGRVGLGHDRRLAPQGSYLLAVRVRDAAGNAGPTELPPRRGTVRGHPGLSVRYLAAAPFLHPTRAGTVTSFRVFAAGRRYRWRVQGLGDRRASAHGTSRAGTLHVRAPAGASGLAVLELRSGRHLYRTPLAVQDRRHRRVLVVLPAITWQAVNPVEANGDGYPDVLPVDRAVGLERPFAGGGLPPSYAETAALVGYLRSARLPYDLTTDLALARAGEAPLRRYAGVLIAGSERFAPSVLTRALSAFVQHGGRIAWIGTHGFSQTVTLGATVIARGRPSRFLGERVRVEPGPRALVVLGDRVSFFRGVSGPLGPFPRLEPTIQLPAGSRVLASAGADPRRPDIVVYQLGRGIVARIGVDGFARSVETSPSDGRIMRRLWDLLSR